MLTTPLLLSVGVFLGVAALGYAVVPWLLAHGIGKRIRADGPEAHMRKAGTATMGGMLFVIPAIVAGAVGVALGQRLVCWSALATAGFALLGAFDDWQGLQDQRGVGWLARNKFPWQWGLGLALALGMYVAGDTPPWRVPLWGQQVDLGWWFVPAAALFLVGFANAANFTDGLDGLAGGAGAMLLALFGGLALAEGLVGLGTWALILLGGILGFLWHNIHPARIFMGDVGSQALGAALATLALLTGHALLLPLAGIVMVAEVLSVMIQVSYFKYTRRRYGEGRRIFRMTPLHHHFELLGWQEMHVTQRFWLATAAASLLALALAGVPA